MDINISDYLTAGAMLIAAVAGWIKIRLDIDKKIEDTRRASSTEIDKVKEEITIIRSTVISRTEHDQDIQQVKQEIRAFRDEVRDDIRSLNTNLSARFDALMQKMFDMKT